jgi:protein TonB
VAFEAYRTQTKKGSLAKRVIFVLVAVLHGAAIAAGVVYSYWHVDELTPPTLRVTFISAAPPPPPPPPPPPAGGGAKPKKVAMKTVPTPVVPKPTEIVQPREKPAPVKKPEFRKHDDEEDDEDDDAPPVKGGVKGGIAGGEEGGELGGVVGGKKGGQIGGQVGGTGIAPAPASKFLPPNLGALQKISGDDPAFPNALNRAGHEYVVNMKICVSPAGTVTSVTPVGQADSLLVDSIVRAVTKTWRYRPLMAGSTAVPFCYFGRFEFKSH